MFFVLQGQSDSFVLDLLLVAAPLLGAVPPPPPNWEALTVGM